MMPEFLSALRARNGMAARALEFTISTAARTAEVLGARWGEIDLDDKIWTVPAERMKADREHRVPLSDAAISALSNVLPLALMRDGKPEPGAPVFPWSAPGSADVDADHGDAAAPHGARGHSQILGRVSGPRFSESCSDQSNSRYRWPIPIIEFAQTPYKGRHETAIALIADPAQECDHGPFGRSPRRYRLQSCRSGPNGSGTRYTARCLHKHDADRKKHEDMGFFDGWGTMIQQMQEVAQSLP
jgi:integrase